MNPDINYVQQSIYIVRGQRVMLDSDLAILYEVATKAFNRQVRRNRIRFPDDFMFQLTLKEANNLRCQIGTSSLKRANFHGGRRYLPFVFTEHGVAMLSSVLKSDRGALVNIAIMRAFVGLRKLLATHQELAEKLGQLEDKYDHQFKVVFDAIRDLIDPPLVLSPIAKVRGFAAKDE